MASSNVEMLRGAYDHFNRHTNFDWSLIHPDVEWNAFSFAPVSEFRGHDGVREWLADAFQDREEALTSLDERLT